MLSLERKKAEWQEWKWEKEVLHGDCFRMFHLCSDVCV